MKKYIITRHITKKQIGGSPYSIRQHRNNKDTKDYNKCIEFIASDKFTSQEIGKGGQAKIYIVENEDCGTIVIKHFNKSTTFIRERDALLEIKKLIINNTCPNFILMHDSNETNKNIYLEYIDKDIKHLYNNFMKPICDEECKTLFFQILYGLLCQYELCNILHNDTQIINIFVKFIDINSVFCYTINDKKYYVPTYGNLFMLGDYGCAETIDNKMEQPNTDFHKFLDNVLFVFTRKLYEDDEINTLEQFYKIVARDVMVKNGINYDKIYEKTFKRGKSKGEITRKAIRKLMLECIKLKLFNYKEYFVNYNVIDTILEIFKYNNIIEVFENVYTEYSPTDTDKVIEFAKVVI